MNADENPYRSPTNGLEAPPPPNRQRNPAALRRNRIGTAVGAGLGLFVAAMLAPELASPPRNGPFDRDYTSGFSPVLLVLALAMLPHIWRTLRLERPLEATISAVAGCLLPLLLFACVWWRLS